MRNCFDGGICNTSPRIRRGCTERYAWEKFTYIRLVMLFWITSENTQSLRKCLDGCWDQLRMLNMKWRNGYQNIIFKLCLEEVFVSWNMPNYTTMLYTSLKKFIFISASKNVTVNPLYFHLWQNKKTYNLYLTRMMNNLL